MDDRPANNVTTRSTKAVYAAADHLTAVTTEIVDAARTTGIANLADASTVLTATNAEAWEVAQWENATHPATTTVATTKNARIAALVAIVATLTSATTAGNAAATVAAETTRCNACAVVAETAGSGAGAATVATARNAAATETTVGTARNVAVANGTVRNAVDAAATASTARNAGAAVDTIVAKVVHIASAATAANMGGRSSTSKRPHRWNVRENCCRCSCRISSSISRISCSSSSSSSKKHKQQQQQQQQQPLPPTPATSQPLLSVVHQVRYSSQPSSLGNMGGYSRAQYPFAQAPRAPMLHQSQLSSTVYSEQQGAPPRITTITLPRFDGRARMNRGLNQRGQDRPRSQPI